jgi:branched-chain amino acid aminotransferase
LPVWCWEICQENEGVSVEPVALPDSCRGLDLISACLPAGSYTTFRTYKFHYALLLDDHLHRLVRSANLSGKQIRVDFEDVRRGLRLAIAETVRHAGKQLELRIRLTLDLEDQPGRVFINAEELRTPDERAYSEGVKVVTSQVERYLPAAKLTGFIKKAGEARQVLPADAYEAVMVDEAGRIKEGLSSNFFAVWDGMLWTAGEGVLPGVTRALVLASAEKLGIALRLEAVRVEQIAEIQEAFITSSSRGVLPVIQVDEVVVGKGRPGKMTRRIAAEFERLIEAKLEPV